MIVLSSPQLDVGYIYIYSSIHKIYMMWYHTPVVTPLVVFVIRNFADTTALLLLMLMRLVRPLGVAMAAQVGGTIWAVRACETAANSQPGRSVDRVFTRPSLLVLCAASVVVVIAAAADAAAADLMNWADLSVFDRWWCVGCVCLLFECFFFGLFLFSTAVYSNSSVLLLYLHLWPTFIVYAAVCCVLYYIQSTESVYTAVSLYSVQQILLLLLLHIYIQQQYMKISHHITLLYYYRFDDMYHTAAACKLLYSSITVLILLLLCCTGWCFCLLVAGTGTYNMIWYTNRTTAAVKHMYSSSSTYRFVRSFVRVILLQQYIVVQQ